MREIDPAILIELWVKLHVEQASQREPPTAEPKGHVPDLRRSPDRRALVSVSVDNGKAADLLGDNDISIGQRSERIGTTGERGNPFKPEIMVHGFHDAIVRWRHLIGGRRRQKFLPPFTDEQGKAFDLLRR